MSSSRSLMAAHLSDGNNNKIIMPNNCYLICAMYLPSVRVFRQTATATVSIFFAIDCSRSTKTKIAAGDTAKVIKMDMGQYRRNEWKISVPHRLHSFHEFGRRNLVSCLIFIYAQCTLWNVFVCGAVSAQHRGHNARPSFNCFFPERENDCSKLLLLFSFSCSLLLWLFSKRLTWQCHRVLCVCSTHVIHSIAVDVSIINAQIIMIEIIQYRLCVECRRSTDDGDIVRSTGIEWLRRFILFSPNEFRPFPHAPILCWYCAGMRRRVYVFEIG